jgi:hypothetical protein
MQAVMPPLPHDATLRLTWREMTTGHRGQRARTSLRLVCAVSIAKGGVG